MGLGSPNSAEWHEFRKGGIGSSDAPIIAHFYRISKLNFYPYDSFVNIIATKVDKPLFEFESDDIRRGKDWEDAARESAIRTLRTKFEPQTFVCKDLEGFPLSLGFIRSSVDGYHLNEENGAVSILEIKCPRPEKVDSILKKLKDIDNDPEALIKAVPPEYYIQVAHQMMSVLGCSFLNGADKPSLEYSSDFLGKCNFYIYLYDVTKEEGYPVRLNHHHLLKTAKSLLPVEVDFWTRFLPALKNNWTKLTLRLGVEAENEDVRKAYLKSEVEAYLANYDYSNYLKAFSSAVASASYVTASHDIDALQNLLDRYKDACAQQEQLSALIEEIRSSITDRMTSIGVDRISVGSYDLYISRRPNVKPQKKYDYKMLVEDMKSIIGEQEFNARYVVDNGVEKQDQDAPEPKTVLYIREREL